MRGTDVFGNLNDRVAIVTGSGANIGEACARALAAAGAHVVVADINLPAPNRSPTDIVAGGGSAMAHGLDLADEQSTSI